MSCLGIYIVTSFMLCCTGLFAGVLAKKFGPRFCIMLTGMLSSTGLIICSCATSEKTLLFGLLLLGKNWGNF